MVPTYADHLHARFVPSQQAARHGALGAPPVRFGGRL